MKTDESIVRAAYNKYTEACNHLNDKDYNQLIKFNEYSKELFLRKDVARLPAVYHFSQFIKKYNITPDKTLTFSGESDFELKCLKINKWDNYVFDQDPINNDVQSFDFENKDYDLALLNQTFEHLVDPYSAIQNIYNHLRPGGVFACNWPVINIRHMEPFHFFTGLTVTYINYLFLKTGFEITECGSWGNKEYIDFIFEYQTWPDYTQVSLKNKTNCPCIGWVFGRKPATESLQNS